jgi:hypothetical protein
MEQSIKLAMSYDATLEAWVYSLELGEPANSGHTAVI